MAIKLASEQLTFPEKFSLQEIANHSLAKIFWGESVLRRSFDTRVFCISSIIEKLIAHRKAVLNKVHRAFSTCLPKKLTSGVLDAVIELQEGYYKAIIWEKKYQCTLACTILNSQIAGSYAAGYFITPLGHFDDLSWVKIFVTDMNQCILKRFQFACFYGFEDEIVHLWHTMKNNEQLPCKGNLDDIKAVFGHLVGLWAYQLENKVNQLSENSFFFSGFLYAISECHEYAARFFWIRCSDSEKRNWLQNFNHSFLLDAARNNYAGFVYFIYSLLPIENKNHILLRAKYEPDLLYIWACLLHSPFCEIILKDFLSSSYLFPSYIYSDLLDLLIYSLSDFQISFHEAVFNVLWNKFSQIQEDVLHKSLCMIRKLAKINAINQLEIIIQTLKKEKLLKEHPFVAITPLFEFSHSGNYGSVLRYILSFLFDRSLINQKLSLRADASKILDHITQEVIFEVCMEEVSEPERNEVKNIIENVQGSLKVLDQLLEGVEEMENVETKTVNLDFKL